MTLEDAILAADLASATDLVRSGAVLNASGPEGFTPLMIAAGLGQVQTVQLLLTAGADLYTIDPRMGASALHKAAQSGNADVLGLLLDHGAFVDQQSPVLGHTALMDAVLHKHEQAVALLLRCGARTMIRNHWQQSALDLARADGLDAIAQLIVARDASDAEAIAALPLVAAVKAGNREAVERDIAKGADIELRVPITGSLDDDYTPLGLAAREGHDAIVALLIAAGADPRRTIGLMKGSPLHEAAFFGRADIVRLITQRANPDLDAQGPYNGLTALHDAVWHGHHDAATALVDAGARTDLRTHAGLTARELAELYGYGEIAKMLAERERERPSTSGSR